MLAFNENIMNRLTDVKQANGLEWDKYKRSATSASCGTAVAPHLPFKLLFCMCSSATHASYTLQSVTYHFIHVTHIIYACQEMHACMHGPIIHVQPFCHFKLSYYLQKIAKTPITLKFEPASAKWGNLNLIQLPPNSKEFI